MFTGIIQGTGTVVACEQHADNSATLRIQAPSDLISDLEVGGSLAVSGVCLTAIEEIVADGGTAMFSAVAMGETLERTILGSLAEGSRVNLERCTRIGDRLDGHIVQGHVDGVGKVLHVEDEGSWRRVRIEVPARLSEQIAEKGSVAVDGVSLTVTVVSEPTAASHFFEVALIPETLEATTLGERAAGDVVNIETDVFAKYTARLVAMRGSERN